MTDERTSDPEQSKRFPPFLGGRPCSPLEPDTKPPIAPPAPPAPTPGGAS